MKKIVFSLILCACALGMNAQALKQQGKSAEQILPKGWEHKEAVGDLNKDGIKDLVVLAKPNFKENMQTRDDCYEYNFNPYILAIYFGQSEGGFKQWKLYEDMFEPDSEWTSVNVDIEITERGTLNISPDHFASAGSYGTSQTTYTFRFQNGDFYLIGKECTEMSRSTGEMTTVSENYLTWKRQTIEDNAFEEVKKKEKWEKMEKEPLKKLGDEGLE